MFLPTNDLSIPVASPMCIKTELRDGDYSHREKKINDGHIPINYREGTSLKIMVVLVQFFFFFIG